MKDLVEIIAKSLVDHPEQISACLNNLATVSVG